MSVATDLHVPPGRPSPRSTPICGPPWSGERERQRWNIELIASENYAFAAVLEAQGSWLTNKYAEGLPGKRYYGGCEFVDEAERLAAAARAGALPRRRARQCPAAFRRAGKHGRVHLRAQHRRPRAGHEPRPRRPPDARLAGQLFSGKWFEIHAYGVREEDARIDYDALEKQAQEVRPKMIVAGASAYPRIIDFERIGRDRARSVDALLMVDMAHIAGLVAAGLHPSPFPHADLVTTTTHKTLRGPRGGLVFCRADLGKQVDKTVFPGLQGGPLMHVIAAKAVALKLAATDEFRTRHAATPWRTPRCWPRTLAESGARSSPAARTTT